MAIRGTVKRGSIVIMNLDPQAGHEQAGTRPAIVLSDGLIDPAVSSFALIVPVTNQTKGLAFEVPVPGGIRTTGKQPFLEGYVLTDQPKSLDLKIRNAKVVGELDITSDFFRTVITNVRSILA
ncbi:mRNA interferase PemK [compost metagenome]